MPSYFSATLYIGLTLFIIHFSKFLHHSVQWIGVNKTLAVYVTSVLVHSTRSLETIFQFEQQRTLA